jgi:hypothetical protein
MSSSLPAESENILDTRPLSPGEYDRVVERLQWRRPGTQQDRREEARIKLDRQTVVLCQIENPDPDAPVVQFLVHPRDISPSGLGFFHNQFIHPGSSCTLTLVLKQRYGIRLNGTIQSSRHIERNVHKIGVRFHYPLELAQLGLEFGQ